ncbi:MAG: hypothetical protein VX527_06315, partial [Planctomycetota bacterium]|nr:hypothetical protein [Planctomycetota bacterium]
TYGRMMPVPTGFNAGVAGHWLDQWDMLLEQSRPRSDVAMLQHLLRMRLMNQSAAVLADGHASKAIKLLRELEAEEASEDAPVDSQEPPMSTRAWGHRMSKARTREDKIRILDELLKFKAGELTTHDASVLANVAVAESERIREHGHKIIEQRFRNDPEFILALLDQVPTTPSKSVSDFMEAIVGHSLPHVQSSRWSWEIRRILANRAMKLRAADAEVIDGLTSEYVNSVLDEVRRLTDQELENDMLPAQALALLADARANRVRGVMSASDLSILTEVIKQHELRFRLAEDSVQMALVRSLAVLKMLTLEWSIKMPSHATEIEMIEEDALLELSAASHVLDQFMIVEQAIGETWRIVLLVYRQKARAQKESTG